MSALESKPVEIRFFQKGSVEQVDIVSQADNLDGAFQLVRRRFPEAAFVRCGEHEPDGGCVFVYANGSDLNLDEQDAAKVETVTHAAEGYGRWVGLISAAERDAPVCERPSSHGH